MRLWERPLLRLFWKQFEYSDLWGVFVPTLVREQSLVELMSRATAHWMLESCLMTDTSGLVVIHQKPRRRLPALAALAALAPTTAGGVTGIQTKHHNNLRTLTLNTNKSASELDRWSEEAASSAFTSRMTPPTGGWFWTPPTETCFCIFAFQQQFASSPPAGFIFHC